MFCKNCISFWVAWKKCEPVWWPVLGHQCSQLSVPHLDIHSFFWMQLNYLSKILTGTVFKGDNWHMMQKAKKKLSEVFHSLHGYACLPIHANSDEFGFISKSQAKLTVLQFVLFQPALLPAAQTAFWQIRDIGLFLTSQSLCLLWSNWNLLGIFFFFNQSNVLNKNFAKWQSLDFLIIWVGHWPLFCCCCVTIKWMSCLNACVTEVCACWRLALKDYLSPTRVISLHYASHTHTHTDTHIEQWIR